MSVAEPQAPLDTGNPLCQSNTSHSRLINREFHTSSASCERSVIRPYNYHGNNVNDKSHSPISLQHLLSREIKVSLPELTATSLYNVSPDRSRQKFLQHDIDPDIHDASIKEPITEETQLCQNPVDFYTLLDHGLHDDSHDQPGDCENRKSRPKQPRAFLKKGSRFAPSKLPKTPPKKYTYYADVATGMRKANKNDDVKFSSQAALSKSDDIRVIKKKNFSPDDVLTIPMHVMNSHKNYPMKSSIAKKKKAKLDRIDTDPISKNPLKSKPKDLAKEKSAKFASTRLPSGHCSYKSQGSPIAFDIQGKSRERVKSLLDHRKTDQLEHSVEELDYSGLDSSAQLFDELFNRMDAIEGEQNHLGSILDASSLFDQIYDGYESRKYPIKKQQCKNHTYSGDTISKKTKSRKLPRVREMINRMNNELFKGNPPATEAMDPEQVLIGAPGRSYLDLKQKALAFQNKESSPIRKYSGNIYSSGLDTLAAEAQAKITLIDEHIDRLQDLQREFENKAVQLQQDRAKFETNREQERLKLAAERESLFLEIEKLSQQRRNMHEDFQSNHVDAIESISLERDKIDDENRRLRVQVIQMQDEFSIKEERYRKLLERLGNQLHAAERKNKALSASLEQLEARSQRCNSRAKENLQVINREKPIDKPKPNRQQFTRRSISPVNTMRKNDTYVKVNKIPLEEDYEYPISTTQQISNQQSVKIRNKNNNFEDNSMKAADDHDDSASVSTRYQSSKCGDHLTTASSIDGYESSATAISMQNRPETTFIEAIEKNPLPLSEYEDLINFTLDTAWEPFTLAMRALEQPESLQLTSPSIKKPDGRQEYHYKDGHREVIFINGMKKVICPNGWLFTMFTNGDIRGTDPHHFVYYYYKQDSLYSITTSDGRVYYAFPDGQVDCKYPNGKIQVRFPQRILKQIDPDQVEHIQRLER